MVRLFDVNGSAGKGYLSTSKGELLGTLPMYTTSHAPHGVKALLPFRQNGPLTFLHIIHENADLG